MEFRERVIVVLHSVPKGKVVTYGQVAAMCGNPRAARQVARILHSSSEKFGLPWYRVINSAGKISLPGDSKLRQKGLLESEGVEFDENDKVDLKRFLYSPG